MIYHLRSQALARRWDRRLLVTTMGPMLAVLHKVAREEGFVVHPDKISIKHRGRRQEVTGLVVNDRLAIDRRTLRRLRAFLFQLEKDGPEGKRWGTSDNPIAAAVGFANYVAMVDLELGAEFRKRALALRSRHQQ